MKAKTRWVSVSILLCILLALWGVVFYIHSTPEKVVGSKVIGEASFANGVVIITQGKDSTMNASYLTSSFLGWKVNVKSPPIENSVTSSDVSTAQFSVSGNTFVWGIKKLTINDVTIKYNGKMYISKKLNNSNTLWYLDLPLSHTQFINSIMSYK